jgi:hypothetical protein
MKEYKYFLLWCLAALVLWGMAGMADGTAETLQFHYSAFKSKCPSCDDQYWWPEVSWTNKYYQPSEALRPKFPGSTTVFVWTTDAYHLFRSLTTWFLVAGWLVMCMSYMRLWIELRWWSLLVCAAGYWAAKAVGFHLIYTLYFNS